MPTAARTINAARVVVISVALALAGCGGDDEAATPPSGQSDQPTPTATVQARDTPTEIAGGTTTLELSSALKPVLAAAGVEIQPLQPAREGDAGIEIPITGGELGTDPLAGRLRHDGGIRLSAGGANVDVTDVRLDVGKGAVTAQVAGERVSLLSTEFETPELSDDHDSVVLRGSGARLSDEAVIPINDALGTDLLSGGLSIGDLDVNARWR